MRSAALWGVAAAVLLTCATARGDAFEDACDAARARRHPALVELATWCHERKLYATRNELAREILDHDPDDTQAHRWLRHRLGAGGVWEEPARAAPARDRDPDAAAELPAVRARLLGEVADALLAALSEHAELVTPGRREALLSEILVMVPERTDVRLEHGEEMTGDGWRLAETVRGRERRALFRRTVRDALEAVGEPRTVAASPTERATGIRWKGVVAADDVRVLSTAPSAEARDIARGCQVVPDHLRTALGVDARLAPGHAVYSFDDRGRVGLLFESHPLATDDTRKHWRRYGATFLGTSSQIAVYHADAALRLEAAVRMTISHQLAQHVGYGIFDAPWASLGFKRRLTWEIVGTRRTHTRTESEYADTEVPWADWGELDDAGWYQRARETLDGMTPADLSETLGRPTNLATIRDEVVFNAIAAYFIEGRPADCVPLLTAAAAGKGPHVVLEEVAALDLEALRLRLLRWLDERRP